MLFFLSYRDPVIKNENFIYDGSSYMKQLNVVDTFCDLDTCPLHLALSVSPL